MDCRPGNHHPASTSIITGQVHFVAVMYVTIGITVLLRSQHLIGDEKRRNEVRESSFSLTGLALPWPREFHTSIIGLCDLQGEGFLKVSLGMFSIIRSLFLAFCLPLYIYFFFSARLKKNYKINKTWKKKNLSKVCQRVWKESKRPGEWVCRDSWPAIHCIIVSPSCTRMLCLSCHLTQMGHTTAVELDTELNPNGFEEHRREFIREVPLIRSHISHLHRNGV